MSTVISLSVRHTRLLMSPDEVSTTTIAVRAPMGHKLHTPAPRPMRPTVWWRTAAQCVNSASKAACRFQAPAVNRPRRCASLASKMRFSTGRKVVLLHQMIGHNSGNPRRRGCVPPRCGAAQEALWRSAPPFHCVQSQAKRACRVHPQAFLDPTGSPVAI